MHSLAFKDAVISRKAPVTLFRLFSASTAFFSRRYPFQAEALKPPSIFHLATTRFLSPHLPFL